MVPFVYRKRMSKHFLHTTVINSLTRLTIVLGNIQWEATGTVMKTLVVTALLLTSYEILGSYITSKLQCPLSKWDRNST